MATLSWGDIDLSLTMSVPQIWYRYPSTLRSYWLVEYIGCPGSGGTRTHTTFASLVFACFDCIFLDLLV
jgi:hypothetical protein